MDLKINKNEIDNVIKLSGEKRYQYFIKRVADTTWIWGLYNDGWALVSDDTEQTYVPLWPAPEYALLCATGPWKSYQAEAIEVHEFINEYLEELKKNLIKPAVFYTPNDFGVIPSYEQLLADLNRELSKIE